VSDELAADARGQGEAPRRPSPSPGAARPTGSFALRLYKPGQGYYTRICTAIGIGVLSLFGARFIMQELEVFINPLSDMRLPLTYGIPTGFLCLMAVVVYWVAGLSRKANDFFIATEGEMKKVSWSTRQEIIKSTIVVIVTVALLAAFLFFWDIYVHAVLRSDQGAEGHAAVAG